jgi:2,3,4,5-tetrahydropyridine-2-carboxylate N-succinyltransferase
MDRTALQARIEALWGRRDTLNAQTSGSDRTAVEDALALLDSGGARVAEPESRKV